MLFLLWKVRGLVCRGIMRSWCLMKTSSVLSLLVSLVTLALLKNPSAWALCAFDISEPWLRGSAVCVHLSKRMLPNRDIVYVAWDPDFGWLKIFLTEPLLLMGYVSCFYLSLAILLLPIFHLVCILTRYCIFDCLISRPDFWETFIGRKLHYKQQK